MKSYTVPNVRLEKLPISKGHDRCEDKLIFFIIVDLIPFSYSEGTLTNEAVTSEFVNGVNGLAQKRRLLQEAAERN